MQAELLKIPDYDEKILDIGQLNIVIVLSEKIGNISKKAEINCVGDYKRRRAFENTSKRV